MREEIGRLYGGARWLLVTLLLLTTACAPAAYTIEVDATAFDSVLLQVDDLLVNLRLDALVPPLGIVPAISPPDGRSDLLVGGGVAQALYTQDRTMGAAPTETARAAGLQGWRSLRHT